MLHINVQRVETLYTVKLLPNHFCWSIDFFNFRHIFLELIDLSLPITQELPA